ncbi:S8 family peptidase [Anaerolineales bacterium HSG24]|nr:S8 family peptidase [Anaerolineales bacterium HSG24]
MTFRLFSQLSWLLLGLLMVLFALPSAAQEPNSTTETTSLISGQLIVKLKTDSDRRAGQRMMQTLGYTASDYLPHSHSFRVYLPAGQEQKGMERLANLEQVEFVTYNHQIQALEAPSDPYYDKQWALDNPDDHDIDAPEAWDITTGKDNIIIAVIDSGLDMEHPEFEGRIVAEYNYINPGMPPDDDFQHGTHVAGIAAATGDNEIGIAGIAWHAQIMPLKVLDASGNGNSATLAEAIYLAVDRGAKIINMSVGERYSSWSCEMEEVEAAFEYADQNGVLLVSAAGNDYKQGVNCPAAYEQAIAVGSTTNGDHLSSFSNYGPLLDIVAPGGGGTDIYSTVPGGGYSYKRGTSMATPHVSGVAALVWSLDPTLTHHQIRAILEETADDLGSTGWDKFFGWGRINAWQAVSYLTSPQVELHNWQTKVDDDDHFPMQKQVQIETEYTTNTVNWTANIVPAVSWVNVSTNKGIVSTSLPARLTLNIERPESYGVYTTTLYIDAGKSVGYTETELRLDYLPKWHKTYLPVIR